MTTESAAWGSQLTGWPWPLAPGTASSKSGTEEARAEVGSAEGSRQASPLPISLGPASLLYPRGRSQETSFRAGGIMGVCLWKHQGLKGKELPHFLPRPPLQSSLLSLESSGATSSLCSVRKWPECSPGLCKWLQAPSRLVSFSALLFSYYLIKCSILVPL